jgi:hypothetical protein
MRRIAVGIVLVVVGMASGCGSGRSIYRDVGMVPPPADPAVGRASVELDRGGLDPNAAMSPRFSRAAVPDAVMLRDQAEAGFRDPSVPY